MFRSDVVGSLLRPARLKEARERHEAGQLTEADFKRIEDHAVNEAIALQERAGTEVLTDGEMRRYAFFGHLIDAVRRPQQVRRLGDPFPRRKWGEVIV